MATYASPDLDDLPAVVGNIDGLRAVLTDPGLCGFAAEHIAVVRDPRTASELMDPVGRALEQADDVQYAGHRSSTTRRQLPRP